MVRTPCRDKNGLRKGTWTAEEDRKLIDYVNRYGCWNWRQLPKYAGLARCGKSCRLRWMNYLRPNIKRGDYSREEEEIIIRLHESLGNRWSAIAAQLPGRTDNEIKNHWHTNLKKRVLKQNSVAAIEAKPNLKELDHHEITIHTGKEQKVNVIPNLATLQQTTGSPIASSMQQSSSSNLSRKETSQGDSAKLDQFIPWNPANPLNVETPTLSSPPSSSSSDFSSITADISSVSSMDVDTTTPAGQESLKSDNDGLGFFQTYDAAPIESFWTEAFLADNYLISDEFFPPSVETFSSYLDSEAILPLWSL